MPATTTTAVNSARGSATWWRRFRSDAERSPDELASLPWSRSIPAAFFVIIYIGLLFCIPSQLIVRQVGAPGTPANLWGIFCLLWWICVTIGGRNPQRGLTPLRIGIGLLVITVLLSYGWGTANGWYSPVNIHEATGDVYSYVPVYADALSARMTTAADRGLLSLAGWSGVALMTADGLRSWRDLELVITWLSRFGVFVAVLGIIQYFTRADIASYFVIPGLSANSDFGAVSSRSDLARVSSTAVHPIEFGVVMSVALILSLHRSAFSGPGTRLRWMTTVVVAVAIPMSVSRSAILVAALAGLVLFVSWPAHWRLRALLALPLAAVAVRQAVPGLLGTIRSLFLDASKDPSISGRTDDYASVFALFGDSPWLGRGLFTFVPQYYRILDNQILMILVELGVIGLLVTLGLFAVGFFLARGAALRSVGPNRHLSVALSASTAGVILSYLTFDAWGFPMVAGLTFLLLGLSAAAWRLAGGRLPTAAITSSKRAVGASTR